MQSKEKNIIINESEKSESEFYWDWVKHEDHVFTNRGSFFLIGESMMLAGVAALLSSNVINLFRFLLIFGSAGIFVTLVWIYVNCVHVFVTQKSIKLKLLTCEPRWSGIAIRRRKWLPNHFLMGIVLPSGILVVWFLLLMASIRFEAIIRSGTISFSKGGSMETNSLDLSMLISGVAAIGAISSALFAYFVYRVAKRTIIFQALLDLLKDYRSPQLLYAIDSLWEFYKKCDKDKLADEYEKIRNEDKQKISELTIYDDRVKAIQNSLHYNRRIVSHFYQYLAGLYVNKILSKDVIYQNWSESDLRIIPEIIIPIENKLREVLHTPPLAPLSEDCGLLRLYRDSKDR